MDSQTARRSFAIGVASGLRSMTGPAVARWQANDPLRLAFAALAAGELIADKLPATPARTVVPSVVFRTLAGGFAGRSVAVALKGDVVRGAIAGALGALAGTYGGYFLRTQIVRATALPDFVVAIVEDAIAVYGSLAAARV